MDQPTERFLGVHLAAWTAFLALVVSGGALVDADDARSLSPSTDAGIGAGEADYLARARQLLRTCRPVSVAVLNTRSYGGWKYADAFARVSLETCWRIAAAQEGVGAVLITQERAAQFLGVNQRGWTSASLKGAVADRVTGRPLYWGDRSLAYVAAVVAASDAADAGAAAP